MLNFKFISIICTIEIEKYRLMVAKNLSRKKFEYKKVIRFKFCDEMTFVF